MSEAPVPLPGLSDKQTAKLLDSFRVTSGDNFKLKRFAPDGPVPSFVDKGEADALLKQGVERLSELQELLYANVTWSVLLVFQAMDAAGKDGTIKHVMSGVNPLGVAGTSFKAPGPEDLAHEFLWRSNRALPTRGMIGVFNRSYYEEVLIVRVHPKLLAAEHLPPSLIDGDKVWDHRLQDIAAFERHLARQGTLVLKFFLNVSRAEQKRRFLARLDRPDKNWKFSPADITERGFWHDYMAAYEAAIAATATEAAPWFVVPADRKWFMRFVVVEAINAALSRLDLKPVQPTPEQAAQFANGRRALEAEKD